jgi:predicted TPR repeat methyltransferase
MEIREYYENLWNSSQKDNPPKNLLDRYIRPNMIKAAREYKNFSAIEELVEEYLKKNPFEHKTVLSVGCGAGKDLERFRKIFPSSKLFGIDVSSNALKEAKSFQTPIWYVLTPGICRS